MNSKIKSHFRRVDSTLYSLLLRVGESSIRLRPRSPRQYFRALCADIISQQLSGRVADVIWDRFLNLFPHRRVTPRRLQSLSTSRLRRVGISNAKATYLQNLARHFVSRQITSRQLTSQSPDQVVSRLTAVKGIGPWTAEMFLMFTLGHEDIFSPGDQGLKNAISKYYSRPPDPSVWAPFRTYACLILWRSLEL